MLVQKTERGYTFMVSIAEKLKFIRETRRMSQQDVADAAHMSLSLYKQYEYGTRKPKDEQLKRLACALNVDIAFLYPSHLGDSPLSVFALLLDWINQYGNLNLQMKGNTMHIDIDCAGQLSLSENLRFIADAHNKMPLDDFKLWLTDPYIHIYNK